PLATPLPYTTLFRSAGAAAIVWCQHVEALRNIELNLGADPIFGHPGRAAVDMHDRAFWLARAVQPALDLQPIHRSPAEIRGWREDRKSTRLNSSHQI